MNFVYHTPENVMNRFQRLFLLPLLVLTLLVWSRSVLAGPANAKHVSQDAKWYIHLDFDAAKQTVIYTQILDAIKVQFPLEETLAQVKQFMGVNPLTDISGVTVYSNTFEKGDKAS